MAKRFHIRINRTCNKNGVQLGDDMFVEMQSENYPLSTQQSLDQIRELFLIKYSVDLKKANALGGGLLEVKRIN